MQLNPARGRKLGVVHLPLDNLARFMQLNPARGRKLDCLSQPRVPAPGFMQLNPARGRKPVLLSVVLKPSWGEVYAAQPREGTETRAHPKKGGDHESPGLCSSTPRGDGNTDALPKIYSCPGGFMQLNPARGRKLSPWISLIGRSLKSRFMQLNPARGRKLDEAPPYLAREWHGFMQLNPARGRKQEWGR